MGARAQVLIEDTGVYLYTHYGSAGLPDLVLEVIRQGWRLNDPEYFARILLEAMVGNETGSETGFGIGVTEHGDLDYPPIKINLELQTVTIPPLSGGVRYDFADLRGDNE